MRALHCNFTVIQVDCSYCQRSHHWCYWSLDAVVVCRYNNLHRHADLAYLFGRIAGYPKYIAQRFADKLAQRAKATIRQRVYEKLLELGPSYGEQVK